MKYFPFILLLLMLPFAARSAETQRREFCVVCAKGPLSGRIWKHPHGMICRECVKLELKCSICSLPIKADYVKTKDGRYICKFEKDDVVVKEHEAKTIYNSAVRSVLSISRNAMKLRGPAPVVTLIDVPYWSGKDQRQSGFSQSRIVGSRITHNVILLSGQIKDALVGVCAHEYTHLWINENKKANREIERDTIEGICELVAYKVCQRAGFTNQMESIRKNPYTNGRILAMLEAERQYGFDGVLAWVARGTGTTMSVRGASTRPSAQTTARTTVRPTKAARQPTTSAASAIPLTGLKVSSISRVSRGLRAEINGVMFYEGDLKRIRYNGRVVNMQCIRIKDSSVTVSVNRGQPQVVRMGGN